MVEFRCATLFALHSIILKLQDYLKVDYLINVGLR